MKRRFRDSDKPLIPLLHKNLFDLVGDNHLIVFIDHTLADYDLSPIVNRYRPDNVGRPPCDPGKMVRLIVYGYCRGFRSSRQIEGLFEDSIGARSLFPLDPPDHTTINRFRKDNEKELADLFFHTLKKAKDDGLIDPGVGIVDGTKMKANAALSANGSEEEKIARELEAIAAEEASEPAGLPPLARAARQRGRRSRQERRERAGKKLVVKKARRQAAIDEQKKRDEERASRCAETGQKPRGRKRKAKNPENQPVDKVNTTDPESEIMKTSRGYLQGYNAQAVVDKKQIILAASVTTEQNDLQQLRPMLDEALHNLGKLGYAKDEVTTFLADAGYYSEDNMTPREGQALEILAPPARKSQEVVEALKTYKDHPEDSPLATLPRTTPGGRAHYLSTPEGKARYKIRGTTVEPTFGQIKENRKTRTFMRRGQSACDGEWKLICAVHNLHKIRLHQERLKKTA